MGIALQARNLEFSGMGHRVWVQGLGRLEHRLRILALVAVGALGRALVVAAALGKLAYT